MIFMNDENKLLIWKWFFYLMGFAIAVIALVLITIPKDYSFTIKMDDNTLKAVQHFNLTEVIQANNELESSSYREFQYFEYYESAFPDDELTSCDLLCKHYNRTGSVDYDPDKKVLACSCTN